MWVSFTVSMEFEPPSFLLLHCGRHGCQQLSKSWMQGCVSMSTPEVSAGLEQGEMGTGHRLHVSSKAGCRQWQMVDRDDRSVFSPPLWRHFTESHLLGGRRLWSHGEERDWKMRANGISGRFLVKKKKIGCKQKTGFTIVNSSQTNASHVFSVFETYMH